MMQFRDLGAQYEALKEEMDAAVLGAVRSGRYIGGAVCTDDDGWAELVRSYAVHGKGSMKYDNVRVGMNSRLDAVQAAVLLVKLDAFAEHEVDDAKAESSSAPFSTLWAPAL